MKDSKKLNKKERLNTNNDRYKKNWENGRYFTKPPKRIGRI